MTAARAMLLIRQQCNVPMAIRGVLDNTCMRPTLVVDKAFCGGGELGERFRVLSRDFMGRMQAKKPKKRLGFQRVVLEKISVLYMAVCAGAAGRSAGEFDCAAAGGRRLEVRAHRPGPLHGRRLGRDRRRTHTRASR